MISTENIQVLEGIREIRIIKERSNETLPTLIPVSLFAKNLHNLQESVSSSNLSFFLEAPQRNFKSTSKTTHLRAHKWPSSLAQIHFMERIFSTLMMPSALQHVTIRSN